eukprot:TRINITY_DN10436_c0_g1_i1.p1 TRINITY_DN10436_c0_g1~~TRINITY_DN10436_c0_g1_i1.p1  ORF type:complete len:253 (-),score=30.33 TRINITY_DN10436_c0_g1_i1:10-768(-)
MLKQTCAVPLCFARSSVYIARRFYAQASRGEVLLPASRRFLLSTETILEPVIPQHSIFTIKGFSHWKTNIGSWIQLRRLFNAGGVKAPMLGFARRIHDEALDLYKALCDARAANDRKALENLTLPPAFKLLEPSLIKPEKLHELGVKHSATYTKPKLVISRVIQLQENVTFAQLTYRFKSNQKLQFYSKKTGEIIAGKSQTQQVEEYWVLERPMFSFPSTKWRFLGKIDPKWTAETVPAEFKIDNNLVSKMS